MTSRLTSVLPAGQAPSTHLPTPRLYPYPTSVSITVSISISLHLHIYIYLDLDIEPHPDLQDYAQR